MTSTAAKVVGTSTDVGAQAQIYAATDARLDDGDYSTQLIGPVLYGPFAPQTNHLGNFTHPLYNTDFHADRLWDWSLATLKEKTGYEPRL